MKRYIIWTLASLMSFHPVTYAQGVSSRQKVDELHKTADLFLLDRLKEAQEFFLTAPKALSYKKFLSLSKFSGAYDWSDESRSAMQYVFLRLAQLSGTSEERTKWVRKAAAFDTEWSPDPMIFEPPLIQQYNDILANFSKQAVNLPPIDRFDFLLVNGKDYALSQGLNLNLPLELERLTLVYGHQSKPTSVPELAAIPSEMHKSLTGIDEKHQIDKENINKLEQLDIHPVSNLEVSKEAFLHPDTEIGPPKEAKPFYKKNWFWFSTAVALGAGYWLYLENSGEPSPKPTHRTGL